MRINIAKIRREHGASLPIDIVKKQPNDIVNQLTFVPNVPLTVKGSITNTGTTFLLRATVNAHVVLECGRCLNDFVHELSIPLFERFQFGTEHEVEKDEDDMWSFDDIIEEEVDITSFEENEEELTEIHFFQGDSIDLTDVVREQMLVSLPMKRVCDEHCAGLCAHCGANKNVTACDCEEETTDIRMAALAEWFSLQETDDEEEDQHSTDN